MILWILEKRWSMAWGTVFICFFCWHVFKNTQTELLPKQSSFKIFISKFANQRNINSESEGLSQDIETILNKTGVRAQIQTEASHGIVTSGLFLPNNDNLSSETWLKRQIINLNAANRADEKMYSAIRIDQNSIPSMKIAFSAKDISSVAAENLLESFNKELLEDQNIKSIHTYGALTNTLEYETDRIKLLEKKQHSSTFFSAEKNNSVFRRNSGNPQEVYSWNLPVSSPAVASSQPIKIDNNLSKSLVNHEGSPAIIFEIFKKPGTQETDISNFVTEKLKKLTHLKVAILLDLSVYLEAAQNNIIANLRDGILLSCITVFLFLKSMRATIIVAIAIPISILICFPVLSLLNVSRNVMSLTGFALGVGVVVDTGLSIICEIEDRIEKGSTPINAAWRTATENLKPATTTVLTNLAIFVPLFFLRGRIGELFFDLMISLTSAQISSLVVAIFMLPGICVISHEIFPNDPQKKNNKKTEKTSFSTKMWIHNTVTFFVSNHLIYKSVSIASILAVIWGLSLSPPKEILPQSRNGSYNTEVMLDSLSEQSKAGEIQAKISNSLKALGAKSIFSYKEHESLQFKYDLQDQNVSSDQQFDTLKKVDPKLSIKIYPVSPIDPNAERGQDLTFYTDKLPSHKFQIFHSLISQIYGVNSLKTSLDKETKQINITNLNSFAPRTSSLEEYRFELLSTQLPIPNRTGDSECRFYCDKITFVRDKHDLNPTTSLALVPVLPSQKVTEISNKSSNLQFIDGKETIKYEIGIRELTMGDIEKKIEKIASSLRIKIHKSAEQLETEKSLTQLLFLALCSIVLAFLVLNFQFRSLIYSFIALFSFFLGAIGAFPALTLHQKNLDSGSIIGFVLLAGTIVNNGILFIEAIIKLRAQQMNPATACTQAVVQRSSNIVVTSLTTVLSTLPMVYETGEGGSLYQGLSTVIVFGTLVSTPLCMLTIPCLVMTSSDINESINEVLLRIKITARIFQKKLLNFWSYGSETHV